MKPLPSEQRERLRLVEVDADEPIDMSLFPDFFVIGPQRTGSTWLHGMLDHHPQVVMSQPKELFFFDTVQKPEHPNHKSDRLSWYLDRFHGRHRHVRRVRMLLRRLRGLPSRIVRGEASANYATTDPERIDEALVLQPGLKAIMIVRDPVERAWSHAKKDLSRDAGVPMEQITDSDWRQFLRDPYQLKCADYVGNHDRWQAALPGGHLHVERFEEIARAPGELLRRVCTFLGIDDRQRVIARIPFAERVNPTGDDAVPPHLRELLTELLADQIAAVRERFGWSW